MSLQARKKRNGFINFVIEKLKLNSSIKTLKEGVDTFRTEWQNLSEEAKKSYALEIKGNSEKPKVVNGLNAMEILNERREDMDEIEKSIDASDPNFDVTTNQFVLIHLNCLISEETMEALPLEIGLTKFSLRDGLIDNLAALIDPCEFPIGAGSLAKSASDKLNLPRVPFCVKCQNHIDLMNNVFTFIRQHGKIVEDRPYLFSRHGETNVTFRALNWLWKHAYSENGNFPLKVYSYSTLVYCLSQRALFDYSNWFAYQRSKQITFRSNVQFYKDIQDDIFDEDSLYLDTKSRYKQKFFKIGFMSAMQKMTLELIEEYAHLPEISHKHILSLLEKLEEIAVSSVDEVHKNASSASSTAKDQKCENIIQAVLPRIEEIENILEYWNFSYRLATACPHHMVNVSQTQNCSLNITNRRVFAMFAILLPYFHIKPKKKCHFPDPCDLLESRSRRVMTMSNAHAAHWDLPNCFDSGYTKIFQGNSRIRWNPFRTNDCDQLNPPISVKKSTASTFHRLSDSIINNISLRSAFSYNCTKIDENEDYYSSDF